MIQAGIAGYDRDRFGVDGPDVLVAANHTQSLALVFYEIAANAAIHGSLRSDEGRVEIAWQPSEESDFVTLHWRETGGDARAYRPAGFGGKMIDAIL